MNSLAPTRRLAPARAFSMFFVPYLAAALSLQYLSGIYQSELSHEPDEPAHVITSLMIRDYVVSGFHTTPLQYAENYYVHYPKVGLGMWPPFFHTVAAVWMLAAPATHHSLLVLMAVECALLATMLAFFARRFFPAPAAFGLGLLLIFLPIIQMAASTFMVDILLTMMEFSAMLLLVRYFRDGSMGSALAFGLCTSLAMLTKGNANSLLLLPIILVLLTRKFSVLKRPPLYAAGVVIVLLGLPWQILSLRLIQGTIPMAHVDAARVAHLFAGYSSYLAQQLGLPIFLLAVIGLSIECARLFLPREAAGANAYEVAGASSLLFAILIFHCVAPVPGPVDRYAIPMLPVMLFFAAKGVWRLAGLLPLALGSQTAKSAAIAALALVLFAVNTFAIPPHPAMGMDRAATLLTSSVSNQVVVICSDSLGEGAFIVSMALKEQRPQHVILRGSKLLSENTWYLADYRPQFHSSLELQQYFESVAVESVVVDLSNTLWEQDRSLLLQTLRENPSKWGPGPEIPQGPNSRHLLIYQRLGPPVSAEARKNIRVKMRITLGRDLALRP